MQCGISGMCHIVSSSPNVRNGHTAMPTHLPQSWRRRGRLPARRTRQGRSSSPPPTPSSRCQQDKGTKGTLLSSPGYTCSVMHSRAEGPNGGRKAPAAASSTLQLLFFSRRPTTLVTFFPSVPSTLPHSRCAPLNTSLASTLAVVIGECSSLDFLSVLLKISLLLFCFSSSLSLFMTFAD